VRSAPPPPKAPRPSIGWVVGAFALDVVLVSVFAAIGRASHSEDALAGLWTTAWPFLVGVLVGWLVQRAWRNPLPPVRTGLGVWGATLVVGMLIRILADQGIAIAFVIVAAIVLFAFLVGWRAIVALIRRRALARSTS
jgi:peptidoglycan/LPS O-acetylase OafA/YrhL